MVIEKLRENGFDISKTDILYLEEILKNDVGKKLLEFVSNGRKTDMRNYINSEKFSKKLNIHLLLFEIEKLMSVGEEIIEFINVLEKNGYKYRFGNAYAMGDYKTLLLLYEDFKRNGKKSLVLRACEKVKFFEEYSISDIGFVVNGGNEVIYDIVLPEYLEKIEHIERSVNRIYKSEKCLDMFPQIKLKKISLILYALTDKKFREKLRNIVVRSKDIKKEILGGFMVKNGIVDIYIYNEGSEVSAKFPLEVCKLYECIAIFHTHIYSSPTFSTLEYAGPSSEDISKSIEYNLDGFILTYIDPGKFNIDFYSGFLVQDIGIY